MVERCSTRDGFHRPFTKTKPAQNFLMGGQLNFQTHSKFHPTKDICLINSVRWIWLGREGSNLRMVESKSAALPLGYAPIVRAGEHGIVRCDRFRHRRSIEGATPFQQAVGANFTPKSHPSASSLYNELLLSVLLGRFSRPGRGEYRPAES